ncbi:MAG: alpha/beta hydrolase [Cyanobacteria bacterium SZAS-4]|nr:alpha/beta hydrolase [Cyanobacteria bacterium SZAS-4]
MAIRLNADVEDKFDQLKSVGITKKDVFFRSANGRLLRGWLLELPGTNRVFLYSRETLPWLRLYPDWCFPRQILDVAAVFRKPHPPLLLIHGQDDTVTCVKNSKEIYNQALDPKSLVVLPGVGHCSFGKSNEAVDAIKTFLKQNQL